METVKIEDVIHLYMGAMYRKSYVETPDTFSVWHTLTPIRLNQLDDLSIAKVQLQLRPLSSMTEEEALEMYAYLFPWSKDDPNKEAQVNAIKSQLSQKGIYTESNVSLLDYVQWFQYLLSRSYDLFNLIEKGLAIDSTKK